MRCAQIRSGVVVNLVEADPSTFNPGDGSIIIATDTAQIGWTFASGAFTAVLAPVVHQTTGLSFLQFMALFSSSERAAIVNSNDTQAKLFIMMATGAGTLDLGNPEVVAGVGYLASLNLIAGSRVATILSGAPTS